MIWYLNNKENKTIQIETKKAIKKVDNKKEVNFEELKSKNEDSIAYLKVPETNIDYVVVKGNNNSYYLNHNFNRKYNTSGWVFADYRNKFDGSDKNIIIYAHNTMDGSMFGSLKNVLNESWYKKMKIPK